MLLLNTTRDALLAPLQSVAGIVEKRHTLPILSNVLLERAGEAMVLLATDLEIQVRSQTDVRACFEDHNTGDGWDRKIGLNVAPLRGPIRQLSGY